ncbi:hypothetical protein PF010_g8129 [Phytophthora fragariae]|nr:hypothetical protein PF011_g8161 [Phytophthora fragariae]KAE9118681.1 hypothetical protein PF010_g8129 [Phytophthora fragariae]
MSVAGIAYYRGKKNDKVSKSEADKKLESLLIPDQGDVVSLYRTYRAWKAELERTSGDTEEVSTIPEPDLTADNDGEGNADEDDDELDATFAKQALQLKMNSDSGSGWIKSLTGWVLGGKNRNEDDDDNRSVVSTDSEASVASMASDAPSPLKPKKPKRKFNEKKARAWCMKNGVNHKAMSIAQATAKELHKTLSRAKSWGYPAVGGNGNPSDDQLRRLITAGYFLNAAVNKPKVAGKPSRGGPQYFALYSGVLGSLFYGTSMHLLEKRSGTLPSWIIFDSILRLDTTTHLKLATPIDEAWIKEESQEFYDMCMSKRSELPVETIEFDNLSFTLLRSLFGKAFQQINRWEAQLKCTMSIDRNTNTLTVYCAPVNEPQIRASLDKRISALKTRLEEESIEEVYLGTTRVVLGNGFEVRELLFDKDFAAVTVRNLADQTDREVEKRLMQWVKRAKSSAASVRSVEILRHNNSGTASVSAAVKFTSKAEAHSVYEFMRGDCSGGSMGDTVSVTPLRAISSQSKASGGAEFAGRITLTWADGVATGEAKVYFRTANDANAFVRNAQRDLQSTLVKAFAVGPRTDVTADTNTTPVIGRSRPPKPNRTGATSPGKPAPAALMQPLAPTKKENTGSGGAFRVIFDTEAIGRMSIEEQARLRFCVQLNGGLPNSMDEVELIEKIRPTTTAVSYAKIMRKPVAASTRADETIARELEVRFSRMLPLLSCLDDTAVHTDYIDQSRRRAGVVVFCRDLHCLNETYQTARDSPLWGELEKPHGQPIRMEIEHSFTTTLHADMHRCFRNEIAQILTYARAKGAMCQESQSKAFASDAVASKNMVTLKFLGEMAVLQRVKAKFEESMFCEKVESSDLHLLFSVSGRYKISDWMDKHIEDDTTQVRYFIRWIKKTREFWVYGDVQGRAYATKALLQLANDIKDLQVLDKPVRLNSSKIQIKVWMEKAPTAQALFSYFVQSNRRIMVSGTNLQYSSLLQALDAEGLLFKVRKQNVKSQEAVTPDCGLCGPVDEPNVQLTVCNDTFCLDCIQPMLGSLTVTLPIRCPSFSGCGCPLHVDDIAKLLDSEAAESLIEIAVRGYRENHKDIVLKCPNFSCNQVLSTGSITGSQEDIGGRCIYCDVCETSYCIDCTEVYVGRAVPRHAKQTCEKFRSRQVSPQIGQHLRAIHENILNVCCPQCHSVFHDFTGCTSVQCGNTTCRHHFCANCLAFSSTSSSATHEHVTQCPSNPNPASGGRKYYFVSDEQLAATHRALRSRKLENYFHEKLTSESLRGAVYKRIKNDLHDLGLNLPAHLQGQDDGTFSFDDEFETPEDLAVRRHVNKVHSDIVNLKCPKCELVFVDFDFDSCAALTCANPVCKGGFCAYCLEDCGDDAHQHVSKCSLNPNKPYYYVTGEQFLLCIRSDDKRVLKHTSEMYEKKRAQILLNVCTQRSSMT